MPVPVVGLSPELAAYLHDLDARVGRLETPQGFSPAFLGRSSMLTAASAAAHGGCWGVATDLATVVWSDGAHWYRSDTGAQIV